MKTHLAFAYDAAAVQEVAARLDLRDPNARALDKLAQKITEAGGQPIELVCAMATGVGKTYLAAGIIDYFVQQGARNFMIVVPGKTLRQKTINNLTAGHAKSVIENFTFPPHLIHRENFRSGATASVLHDPDTVKVFVFTVQSILQPDSTDRKARVEQEWLGEALYGHLQSLGDLILISDEHHMYADSAVKYSAAVRELDPVALIGLTATPATTDLAKICFRYPLARAISEGFVKHPVLVGRTDNLTDNELQLRDGLALLAAKQRAADLHALTEGLPRVNAVMFVVAETIDAANELALLLRKPGMFESDWQERVLVITGQSKEDELARLEQVEDPSSTVRVVIAVDMLHEGWDVRNIWVIASFRPSVSDTLTEQTLGRGLRLPWGSLTHGEFLDAVEVLSHERYQEMLANADVLLQGLVADRAATDPPSLPSPRRSTSSAAGKPSSADLFGGDSVDDEASLNGDVTAEGTSAPASIATLGDRTTAGAAARSPKLVPARFSLTVPRVVSDVANHPALDLTTVATEGAADVGRRFASLGDVLLQRRALEVTPDPSSPLGFSVRSSLVQGLAMTASQLELPSEDVIAEVKRGLLDIGCVKSTAPADGGAAKRLGEAMVTAAGGPAKASVYTGQLIAAATQWLRKLYAQQPEPQAERRLDSQELSPERLCTRPIEHNRFQKHDPAKAYDGYGAKAMHEVTWFASSPERTMAELLEGSPRVSRWMRLQTGDFSIAWDGGNYHPDFLAVIDEEHFVIEVKGDYLEKTPDSQGKLKAAKLWAQYVTDDGSLGVWKYAFVLESNVGNSLDAALVASL